MGYMASGKSIIGKKIASKLAFKFVDLDKYIEEKENKSINYIFSSKGESYFREIESKALMEVMDKEAVIALGGGTPLKYENRLLIKKGQSVFLDVSPNMLVRRLVKDKANRPLVADLNHMEMVDFVKRGMEERRTFYEEADVIIKSNRPTIKEIIIQLKKH